MLFSKQLRESVIGKIFCIGHLVMGAYFRLFSHEHLCHAQHRTVTSKYYRVICLLDRYAEILFISFLYKIYEEH